jgi:hypothetical protein
VIIESDSKFIIDQVTCGMCNSRSVMALWRDLLEVNCNTTIQFASREGNVVVDLLAGVMSLRHLSTFIGTRFLLLFDLS